MKKNIKMMIFLVPMLLLAMGVCSVAQAGAKTVTISYWDIQPSQNLKFKKELIKRFEKAYPNIKIDFSNLPYEEAHTKLVTAIATGTTPDSAYVQTQWIGEFAVMGALENLEPYVDLWNKKDEIMDLAYKVGRKYKNTLYTFPTELMIPGLYYRADWLKEKGFGSPPKTWYEFLEVARAFTSPEEERYGFSMRGAMGCERYYLMFVIMGTNGRIFDEEGKCVFNNTGGKFGLRWYGDLFSKYKVCSPAAPNNSYMETVAEFSSGTAGMYIHNNYSISKQTWNFAPDGDLKKAREKFGTTPIPAGPYGRYIFVFANTHPIFANSKHKKETWAFIKFLLDQENNSYWSRNLGALPVNKRSFEEDWFKTNPFLEAFKEELADAERVYMYPEYLPDWGPLTHTTMVVEFQKALLGKQSYEKTADVITEAITKANLDWLEEKK